MLKPRKRFTKKELKEDKLVTTIFKVQKFLEDEWQKLVIGIAAFAVVIVVGYMFYQSGIEEEQRASGELYNLEIRFLSAVYDSVLVDGLEDFIVRFDNTKSGANATFYLATTYYNLGNYIRAEDYFKKYVNDYDGPEFIKASATAGIAACYEQRKLYTESAEYYEQALRNFPKEFITPENLLGAARVNIKLDKLDEARIQCRKVLEDYPNTPQAVEAEILLAKI